MADKKYKLNFNMKDGSTQSVEFTVPRGESVTPDYAAAEGEPGYILNRTHWVEKSRMVEILPDTTIEYIEGDGHLANVPGLVLEAGKTYIVKWNGTEYTCVGQDLSALMEMEGAVALGNLSELGLNGNGEPFVLLCIEGLVMVETDTTDPITISIKTEGEIVHEIVHKLDGKFLPDSVVLSLDNKVDKVEGMGLSTNDYTTAEKTKLANLPSSITIDTTLSTSSTNPVQNQVITKKLNNLAPLSHTHKANDITTGILPTEVLPNIPVNLGGTGNTEGYIRAGQKQDATIGARATAEGYDTIASGVYSHAEGSTTTASGNAGSHAEGGFTVASGISSHAEGGYTVASGSSSHAEGWRTVASGENSHAEGEYTVASGINQHVQGKFNVQDDTSTYAHIVGNGTADIYRSNAHTLDWDGNAWFAGKATVSADPTEAMDVVTKQYFEKNIPVGIASITIEEVGKVLISFTIDDGEINTYQAEEGMTWREWCDSDYNTDGRWYVEDDGNVTDGWDTYVDITGEGLCADQVIQAIDYDTYA